MQGHSRWGRIHLRTISPYSLSSPVSASEMQSSSFEMGFSLAWSSPVRQDWLASEPQGSSSCLHIPSTGATDAGTTPSFFYVGSGTEILKLYYLLSPSKHLFNKRQIVGWWQLAFRDPPALDSMSLPTQCKLVCMRWGGTCGKERKVGPVATGTSPESGLSRAFTPQGSQPFPDASLKWIWNPKPFSKCPEVQPSETKDNKGLFKPLTFEG